jgi:hypothetical protein
MKRLFLVPKVALILEVRVCKLAKGFEAKYHLSSSQKGHVNEALVESLYLFARMSQDFDAQTLLVTKRPCCEVVVKSFRCCQKLINAKCKAPDLPFNRRMAREILSLQFGPFANFVGAHFWNIQESLFSYDQQDSVSSVPIRRSLTPA